MRCCNRPMRLVYWSITIRIARRFSGVMSPVNSSTVARNTSMVTGIISALGSLPRFGANSGNRKLASSKVTIITPDAMKISSSRIGNGAPPAM